MPVTPPVVTSLGVFPNSRRETIDVSQVSSLGPLEQAILRQADRAHRAVLLIPGDRDLLDQATGDPRRTDRGLAELTRTGWLVRVRRGAYVVRSRAGTLNRGALALIGDITHRPHLVTGGGALARTGLTDQLFRTALVLVDASQRDWSWQGMTVRHLRVGEAQLWGGAPTKTVARRELRGRHGRY